VAAASKPLVHTYGSLWARNRKNIKQLRALGRLFGIYVLYDGSMPVYIGRGRLSRRIARHQRSRSRGRFWDHFSWYAVPDRGFGADLEALLLRMLPYYLRSLNKQRTRFADAGIIKEEDRTPEYVKKPDLPPKRKRG
jgi:hypothetical protein